MNVINIYSDLKYIFLTDFNNYTWSMLQIDLQFRRWIVLLSQKIIIKLY